MSPRIFFSVLSVIIIGWFAAGTYFYSQQLGQPVFLDHYIEEYSYDEMQIEFYYITNKGDDKMVNVVELGDISGFPDGNLNFFMEEMPYVQHYGPHELRTINVSFDSYEIRSLKEKLVINEMRVHMSDGESFLVDIGEIIIHPEVESNSSYLSQNSSSRTGEWSISYLKAEEDLSINGVDSRLPDAIVNHLKVHQPQSGDPIFTEYNYAAIIEGRLDEGAWAELLNIEYPFNLNEGEGMAISIQNNEDAAYVLNSALTFDAEDKNGSAIKVPAYLNFTPELSGKKVKAVIEQKGGRNK